MIDPADLLLGREDDASALVISDYNTSTYGSNDFPTQRWIVLEPDNIASSFRILNAPRAQNRAGHSEENTQRNGTPNSSAQCERPMTGRTVAFCASRSMQDKSERQHDDQSGRHQGYGGSIKFVAGTGC